MFTPEEMRALVVTLHNEGDHQFRTKWDGNVYVIEPGQEVQVPFLVMCHALGHPDAVNIGKDKSKQFRLDELRRLQVMYGTYDNMNEAGTPPIKGIPNWYDGKPKVRAYLIKDGNTKGQLLQTVVEDWEGLNIQHDEVATSTQQRSMLERMEQLQEQIRQLQNQIEASGGVTGPVSSTQGMGDVVDNMRTEDKAVAPQAKSLPGSVDAPNRDIPQRIPVQ